MKINFTQKNLLGKLSVWLIIFFFIFLGLFFIFISFGEKGGDTFFSNLRLTIPMIIAGICGIFSFFTGFINIIKNKEYTILVFISTIIGFFILYWIIAELLFPH